MEEITVPAYRIKKEGFSWKEWVGRGGEHHTSWTMYEIDLSKGKIREHYSFSKKGWLDVQLSDNILSVLLSLPFHLVEEKDRRKLGPPPNPGSLDRRSIWHPPLVIDGAFIREVPFDAWRAIWPKDGSELAGKRIEMYLPSEDRYPSYYPYWLQISGSFASAKIRVIDSGSQISSPRPPLPRRPPEFLDSGKLEDGRLRFTLRSPYYYEEFLLWALLDEDEYGYPIALKCESRREEGIVVLEIVKEELAKKLQKGKPYRFMLIPEGYDSVWCETKGAIPYR